MNMRGEAALMPKWYWHCVFLGLPRFPLHPTEPMIEAKQTPFTASARSRAILAESERIAPKRQAFRNRAAFFNEQDLRNLRFCQAVLETHHKLRDRTDVGGRHCILWLLSRAPPEPFGKIQQRLPQMRAIDDCKPRRALTPAANKSFSAQ